MIAVRFKGGLGNQMFQYAAARAEAERRGCVLRLDRSWYAAPAHQARVRRTFDLDWFQIRADGDASWWDRALLDAAARPRLARAARLAARVARRRLVRDDRPGFIDLSGAAGESVLLEGYFQHPRHFAGIAEALRREFSPREPLPAEVEAEGERLAAEGTVCVQVRRGDFVSDPETARTHACVAPGYHERAWRMILAREPGARGRVFTDDQAWAREFFRDWPALEIAGPEWDGPSYLHRFYLMTRCRHFILMNSTWGWWAAWMGARAGGRVIVPDRWVAGCSTAELGLLLPGWETAAAGD